MGRKERGAAFFTLKKGGPVFFLKEKRGRPPAARNSAAQNEEPEPRGAAGGAGPRTGPRTVSNRTALGPIVQPGPSKRDREDTSEPEMPQKRDKDDYGDETSDSDMEYQS